MLFNNGNKSFDWYSRALNFNNKHGWQSVYTNAIVQNYEINYGINAQLENDNAESNTREHTK